MAQKCLILNQIENIEYSSDSKLNDMTVVAGDVAYSKKMAIWQYSFHFQIILSIQ